MSGLISIKVNPSFNNSLAVLAVKRTYSVSSDDAAKTLRELKNIDIPGKDGRTPLMLAQEYELRASDVLTPVLIEMGAVYMIKKGADYNIANEDNVTPMQIAVEEGLDDVLPFMGL